jgi:hypothetical protein
MSLSRRRFLTGASGAALALPWLEKLHGGRAFAQATTSTPRRLVVLAYPMGFVHSHWAPQGMGSTFTLPYITAPLEPLRSRVLFVSNVDNKATNLNSQHAHGHPAKKESVLTGTLMRTAFSGDQSNVRANVISDRAGSDQGGPNNESVCNYVGTRLRGTRPFASVDLAIGGENFDRHDLNSDFFFEGPVTPVKVQANPARAFDRYFANVTGDSAALEAQRRARQRKKSALDAVRESFVELRSGLNPQDRTRLEDHANRLRQVELDMMRASCARPVGNYGTPGPTASYVPFRAMSMRERSNLMVPLLTNAMACDLAPVGRLEFIDQQGPLFGVASVDAAAQAWRSASNPSDWHGMVHGDPSPVDGVRTRGPTPATYLLDGYRFFVERLVDVMNGLRAINEGPDGRTALDNTMVVLVSDYGDGGGHSSNKLGFILGGNLGGARTNFHFDGRGRDANFYTETAYSSGQVLNTIIRAFDVRTPSGAPAPDFGLQNFPAQSGTLPVFS